MERATLVAKAALTAGAAGALEADISSLTGDYYLELNIYGLAAAAVAQIALQDTVDDFTANVVRWVKSVKGAITADAPIRLLLFSRDLPAVRAGTGSAELRFFVDSVSSGSVTIEAFIWAPDGQVTVA